MKNHFLLAALTLMSFSSGAQDGNHSLTFSLSNNGQIADVMETFYFNGLYEPNHNTYNYRRRSYNLVLDYNYYFRKSAVGLNVSYGERNEKYEISGQSDIPLGKEKQYYISVGPSIQRIWAFEDLRFHLGFEIPLFFISEHQEFYTTENVSYTITVDPGIAYGLNTSVGFDWFFYKNLYARANASLGVLKFDLGGNRHYEDTSPYAYDLECSFDQIVFTQPALSLGIGIRF